MRIDQLALLFALVIASNVVVLAALEVPALRRPRQPPNGGNDAGNGVAAAEGRRAEAHRRGDRLDDRAVDSSATPFPAALYQRVVRVVSFLFIGSVLVIETVSGGQRIGVYVVAAVGVFLIVLLQDVLPSGRLGRWRLPLEAAAAVGFLTVLLILTGGDESPYFFGYILLLGAASLWATGGAPPLLAAGTSVAYLSAVILASGPALGDPELQGRVAFNLVALSLVTYVASVIGREQRRAREDALRLSRFDALTGLHSRGYFQTSVEQEILRASRTGHGFGLVMIDLDGLKAANDRFGHDSGDRLLQAVADIVRSDIRATDMASRFGGDEFVLILPETDLAGALRVAEKVRVDIARLALPHNGVLIRTSASIGVVTYPEDGRTSSELMRRADLAMYEAKRRGRDQIVRYARETSSPMAEPPRAPATPPIVPATQRALPTTPPAAPAAPPSASAAGSMARQRTPPRPAPAVVAARPAVPPETPDPAPWEVRSR